MAEVTFEQVLEAVRSLPIEERRRLRRWLAEEERRQAVERDRDVCRSAVRREREMLWLSQHQAEYAGQWVALDGDRLLSYGSDARKVYEEARTLGVDVPFMAYAESPDEVFMGGW